MDLHAQGFLWGRGSVGADLSLLIILAAVLLLTVGVLLARRHRYEAHRWVQTAGVVLSFVPILVWMVESLARNIVPNFPQDLGQPAFTLAGAHAVVGAVTAVFGVVIVIVATRRYVGGRSLAAYRTPMRVAYLLYVTAVAVGIAVYIVTYG